MFYYAEIDGEYLVINTHSLTEASSNSNYIAITEEQYTSGELVGMYYNSLYGQFEIMSDEWVAGSNLISYNETAMQLSTKIDNMQVEIDSKVGADHTHEGYASADDLQALEDVVDTKADATHTHSGYATSNHTHDGYATQVALDTLADEVSGKADTAHTHTEYASVSHSHTEYADVNHNHNSDYAPISHAHSDYVTTTTFDALEAEVDGKADANHSHTDYALTSHTHDEYAEVGHSHSNYAVTTHNHDEDYSPLSHSHTPSEIGAAVSGHNHDSDYADINHNHDSVYATAGHDHDEDYSSIGHSHSDYATVDSLTELSETVAGKANASHTHDDRYFTETEINSKLAAKSDATHTHTGVYDESGAAASALESANAYTDSQIDAIVIPDALSDLTTDSTHRLVTDAEKAAWNAKSNFSGNYNDLTNKPSIPSISGLATETYVDEAVSTKADNGHNHDDVYYTETEIDTLLSGKASASHNHNSSYDAKGTAETKANAVQANLDVVSEDLAEHIDNADIHFTAAERTKLSGIAANANNYSHPNSSVTAGTYKSVTVNAQGHVTGGTNPTTLAGYGITDAETKGAASSALASAKEYTDTEIDTLCETVATKANASDLTSHTGNTTVHITSTERTNWNAAKTHANSAHAPANAEPNQNAFSNVVVNGTTIAADSKTDTLTFVAGNNVTITPDATGDSITISSANTVYTHPTTAGNKHIPAGGSSGQILRWASDGTAVWGADNNTTYSNATQTASGLMSDTDKTKLDGIAVGANNYVLPSAGSSLGGVKTGGDVTIASGVITVNDDSHNHVISNVDGLQSALDCKAASSHNHDGVYYTETEVDTLLSGKANSSHGTHVSYSTTAPVMDGTASVGTASTVARSDHKHPTDTTRAAKTDLTSHTSNTSNPHGVTLAQLGVTATAAELNALDGITATVTELNYVDGVTSNIQTQLNGKAASSHGTHVSYGTTAPKANGTAAVGTASTVSRSDHVHPAQTTVSGNAGTATKLATARTISLTGDVTGSTSFDGSGNVSITATVADDSHNHTIANVDGLQTALDGKSATSHNHNSAYISKNLQFTSDAGSFKLSYTKDDNKNLLTEMASLPIGFYTIYSQSGVTGNPKTTEAWRLMFHKTGTSNGWVQAYGSIGSVYANYLDASSWRGWKCIWDNDPNPLWSGQYYMSSPNSTPQTVTPSKKLSECRTGWLLLWSDYDAGSGSNDSDFVTTMIPKNDPSGNKWGGKSFLCDIPRYVGSNAEDVDTERRIIKPIYVHDDCIKGSYQNDKDERNDVVLRAVYEF